MKAKNLMNSIDPNHDGKLTFEEFTHLMGSLDQVEEGNDE
jgi:Ca2+-binding EF-hand superfamily protein